MKKELVLAIIIGFAFGLLITVGGYALSKITKEQGEIKSPLAEETTPAVSPISVPQTLTLISPADQSLTKESKTKILGVTSPFSWVVMLSEKGEKGLQADEKGNFEEEVNLVSGENEIEVKSISETGEEASKVITIVYSTAEI